MLRKLLLLLTLFIGIGCQNATPPLPLQEEESVRAIPVRFRASALYTVTIEGQEIQLDILMMGWMGFNRTTPFERIRARALELGWVPCPPGAGQALYDKYHVDPNFPLYGSDVTVGVLPDKEGSLPHLSRPLGGLTLGTTSSKKPFGVRNWFLFCRPY